MTFTQEVRRIVLSSGKDISERKVGHLRVLSSSEVDIVCVPVLARNPEEAIRDHNLCESLRSQALSEGRDIIFVLQDRFVRSPEMVSGRILSHLGRFHSVFARNCEVRRIDKLQAMTFLQENHSYGDAASRYRYGLFVTRYSGKENKPSFDGPHPVPIGTLVAVSEFSNSRKWDKDGKTILSYEWIRYASLPGVRVVGGMSKMLAAFVEEVSPDDIMSYADLEWSEGKVYSSLGFEREQDKDPVDFWIDPVLYTRTAVGKGDKPEGALFYRNLGSAKYRLKLTQY